MATNIYVVCTLSKGELGDPAGYDLDRAFLRMEKARDYAEEECRRKHGKDAGFALRWDSDEDENPVLWHAKLKGRGAARAPVEYIDSAILTVGVE